MINISKASLVEAHTDGVIIVIILRWSSGVAVLVYIIRTLCFNIIRKTTWKRQFIVQTDVRALQKQYNIYIGTPAL